MGIIFHEATKEFHLYNENLSYLMKVLQNGQIGQLYFGRRVPQKEDYGYLLESNTYLSNPCVNEYSVSLEHVKQEYPSYGTTDFRMPALELLQPNGSRITDFRYVSHKIYPGKPSLPGLPATYTEQEDEADTLEILLRDDLLHVEITLLYTVFQRENAIARSVRFENKGTQACQITRAMSLSLDLPDADYEWIQFSGAWARERHVKKRTLQQGIQSVNSTRGASGHFHNPFVILKRPTADEFQGEVLGFSLVYSGNFLAQAEVDTYQVTRMMMGINPFGFSWLLQPEAEFQTPEAVMVYSPEGMNKMSQTFHRLYRTRLARGFWRDRERPILLNNWEATYFDFDQERLLEIARTAKEDGVELFVLDDGWFGNRCSDTGGLGDWAANPKRFPGGIREFSQKLEDLGLKFGLWFEPEMVNKDSDLYRSHPDWILETPNRHASQGRHQYVLDFSRKEVVDNLYGQMSALLREAKISYIKWDMNRYITECFSKELEPSRQGEVMHRYILGVYDLYERLTGEFPEILFESCASGGGRFDPGLLYYAPQCWTSDDTDAIERQKIQYGTSYAYPLSSIGAHVSATPNHQLNRSTPLTTRGNVAVFGAFGYELDLASLTSKEREIVREQIRFVKKYRRLIHTGTFYRLLSPFEGNFTAWMVVSEDQRQAVVGYYKILNEVNQEYRRLPLQGLKDQLLYHLSVEGVHKGSFYGSELTRIGLITSNLFSDGGDFGSCILILEAE